MGESDDAIWPGLERTVPREDGLATRTAIHRRTRPIDRETFPVLVLARERATGRLYVRAMERVTRSADWLKTATEIEARALGYEEQPPALLMVFPTGNDQSHSQALADLVSRVFAATNDRAAGGEARRAHLHETFDAYCSARELSPRQKRILELYLRGENDKEIAASVGCSEATVYEHWRRMARKAEGGQKADVVTDFHRFLAGTTDRPDTDR